MYNYSTKWTVSVSAVCVIAWCIPSEEWIAVTAYTDTATPIIGDPGCLPSCRPWRSDVPGLILQGPGYCQSRSTAIFPAVLQAPYGFPFPLLGWYSASCWNTLLMMRTIHVNDKFVSQWCAVIRLRAPSYTVRPVINYYYHLLRHECVYILPRVTWDIKGYVTLLICTSRKFLQWRLNSKS